MPGTRKASRNAFTRGSARGLASVSGVGTATSTGWATELAVVAVTTGAAKLAVAGGLGVAATLPVVDLMGETGTDVTLATAGAGAGVMTAGDAVVAPAGAGNVTVGPAEETVVVAGNDPTGFAPIAGPTDVAGGTAATTGADRVACGAFSGQRNTTSIPPIASKPLPITISSVRGSTGRDGATGLAAPAPAKGVGS